MEPSKAAIEAAIHEIEEGELFPEDTITEALKAAYAIDFSAMRAELQAAQIENIRLSENLRCFSCRVAYSKERAVEACDRAYREGWTHEWVGQRVIDLTQQCVTYVDELQAARDEIEQYKKYIKSGIFGPSGCQGTRSCE